MAKGDRITVAIKHGDAGLGMETVTAMQNGRTVTESIDKESGTTWLVVREATRGGTTVRELRVVLGSVVSVLVENRSE